MTVSHPANRWKQRLSITVALLCLHSAFLGERISAQPTANINIHASAEYADFVRAIAVPTALAETRPGDFVKFIRLGKNKDGEVLVTEIGLLPIDQHAGIGVGEKADAFVIAHVHHKLMKQAPQWEDALTVRELGVPNFVISFDGQLTWEVGIVEGNDMYREIGPREPGVWKALR
jgi:hypothetical protein